MADKKISQLTAATTPLAGTEVLPIVQSGSTVKVAANDLTVKNIRSNATTGILQVAGPGTGTTRVMTVPNGDFTVATTGANTFSGIQTIAATFNGVQAEFGFTAGRGLQIATALNGGTNEGSSVLNARGGGAGQFIFQTEGTPRFTMENLGNLVVNTAGKGIDFSANTGAPGETGALLNWYEEGTWTPTFEAETGSGGTATTSGTYTRIGRLVTINGLVTVTGLGTLADRITIGGLPFAHSGAIALGSFYGAEVTLANAGTIAAGVGLLGSTVSFIWTDRTGAGGGDIIRISNITSDSVFRFTVSYTV
jgi:hypothetical protein